MYVYNTNLKRPYSKDLYQLPDTNKLVYNFVDYKLLSFINVYFGFNHITMHEAEKEKYGFMIELPKYRYNVMSFFFKKMHV